MSLPQDPRVETPPHRSALARQMAQAFARQQDLSPAALTLLERALLQLLGDLDDGHTCTLLAAVGTGSQGTGMLDAVAKGMTGAQAAALREQLLATGCVHAILGAEDGPLPPLPLALDGKDRLFLRRHAERERQIAQFFVDGSRHERAVAEGAVLKMAAWPKHGDDGDWQLAAVAAVLRRRAVVVTGGPGTGKTTTILRILEALCADQPTLRIALCAPTGKAAARMDAARAPLRAAAPEAIVPRATTLHRLLRYRPAADTFAHGVHRPLPFDIVVVDEASMVDLDLLAVLTAALPKDCRLLLLGDRDQLAAVGAGQALGDLCAAGAPEHGVGAGLQRRCQEWLGLELPLAPRQAPLQDSVVMLKKTFRFAADSGIARFARAVALQKPDEACKALQAGAADLLLQPHAPIAQLLRPWRAKLEALTQASSPEDALRRLSQVRILCAVRQGPHSVEAANAHIERWFADRLQGGGRYAGQPILVTANDPSSELANGDLGVLWPDETGRLLAWFDQSDGRPPRRILPLRLPTHETAWAITIHKSQGSEFDEALVLLPDQDSELLDAQLLYTAVTRARKAATVVAAPDRIAKILARTARRQSGLLDWITALANR